MISLFNASAVTLLSTLLVWFTAFNVGRARHKYKIQAPAVTGNKVFERDRKSTRLNSSHT